jgi:hypothetical protein
LRACSRWRDGEEKLSAKLVREYTSPQKSLATSERNMQHLPNVNVIISWGSELSISEFSYDGKLLFDVHFLPNSETYRPFACNEVEPRSRNRL